MRYICTSCQAILQTSAGAAPRDHLPCPSCGGEMSQEARVLVLKTDRDPTRRYHLDDLKARLQAEREAAAASLPGAAMRSPDQVWFVGVQGRHVGPLTASGLSGLRARGQLAAGTLIWREGFPAWLAADAVADLRPLLGLPEQLPALPFDPADDTPQPPAGDPLAAAVQPPKLPVDPAPAAAEASMPALSLVKRPADAAAEAFGAPTELPREDRTMPDAQLPVAMAEVARRSAAAATLAAPALPLLTSFLDPAAPRLASRKIAAALAVVAALAAAALLWNR